MHLLYSILCIALFQLVELKINCYGFKTVLVLPPYHYKYSYNNYSEGTIHNFIFSDTTSIVIQCLSNSEKSVLENHVFERDTMEIGNNKVYVSKGFENDSSHIWRQDVYADLDLSVRIRNGKIGNFEPYERALNSIEITRR